MATPRNFTNNASGASLNGSLSAGATTALLNNYSNFPAAPFTATIGRNQTDEEIVLVTAVAGSTVTITRGFDGSAGQAHSAGTSFEHTAVAKDFRDASAHVEATGAVHGLLSALVGVDDVQTLTNKTAKLFKGLADNTGAAFEADNSAGGSGKLFRGLQAGVEKFFVDFAGNVSAQGVTGTTGSFSGALTAAASTLASLSVTGGTTLTGLLTAAGGISGPASGAASFPNGITVPTGKKVTITDAPLVGTDAANQAYVTGLFTTPPAVRTLPTHLGSGTAFPASPVEGDTYRRTNVGTNGSLWRYSGVTALGSSGWVQTAPIVCTSTTRPSGTVLYDGLEIFQTDDKAEGRYDVANTAWHLWDTVTQTYTPTWTSQGGAPALNGGTVAGRYRRMGTACWVRLTINGAAGTNWGAGTYQFSLPPGCAAAMTASMEQWLPGKLFAAGVGNFPSMWSFTDSTHVQPWAVTSGSNITWAAAQSVNTAGTAGTGVPANPSGATFAGICNMTCEGTYEMANG